MNRIIRDYTEKRIPVIGNLKIGEKVNKNGKEYPVSHDYFIVDKYHDEFKKMFGEKPNNLKVLFLEENFSISEHYELRKGSKVYARGNGYLFEYWNKELKKMVKNTIEKEPELMSRLKIEANAEWQEVLSLKIYIKDFKGHCGFWNFTTRGKESSNREILGSIDAVKALSGKFKEIPFILSVEKVISQKMESRAKFPVIKLTPAWDIETLLKVKKIESDGYKISGLLGREDLKKEIDDFYLENKNDQ